MTDAEQLVEAIALALKAALGNAMNAKPLLGDAASGDWYTDRNSGSFSLTDVAQATLPAFYAALDAAGWAVVPKVATEDMWRAAAQWPSLAHASNEDRHAIIAEILRALLAAAPKPPSATSPPPASPPREAVPGSHPTLPRGR